MTTDWYDVKRIGESSYAIWELDRYVCYLVEGTERALLIDTGCGVGDLQRLVKDLTNKPIDVLLTHSHWDHIGNAHQFERVLAHPKERSDEGAVAIDGVTDEFVNRPEQALSNWAENDIRFPPGFDPGSYHIESVSDVTSVYAGEVIDLGNTVIELLPLPGHSPGQLGALDRQTGVLYGADIIGGGFQLLALFEQSDLAEYLASAKLVRDLYSAGAVEKVVTGHLPPIKGTEMAIFESIADVLGEILAGELSGTATETKHGDAIEYSAGGFSVLTGR